MSICSDVYIDIHKAREMVKAELMAEQERLVENAVKGMDKWELSRVLNRDSDIYYYNITSKKSKNE